MFFDQASMNSSNLPSQPDTPSRKSQKRSGQRQYHVALALDPATTYSRQKLQGVLAWMRKHGHWKVAMHEAQPYLPLKELLKWRGDGIVGEFFTEVEESAATGLGIPLVNTSGMIPQSAIPTVCLDDEGAGELAAKHLLGCGLRELHFFGCKHQAIAHMRWRGFQKSAEVGGARAVAHWIDLPKNQSQWVQPKPYLEALRGIQNEAGVFCQGDRIAFGVLAACRELGIPVPGQLSVVGANNDEILCQLAEPPLSSVDEDTAAVGYHAAAMLQQLMSGKKLPVTRKRMPPAGLRQRASSDKLPHGPADLGRALRFIRGHIHEQIGVPDVLRLVPVSRRTLENLFLKEMGHGVYEEIRRLRIERAKELLRETNKSILKVAIESGFKTLQSMELTFRQFEGGTPVSYRKKHLSRKM
jgi:LacI family transcriptional regulator